LPVQAPISAKAGSSRANLDRVLAAIITLSSV
jgi:hypothetical protein